MLKIVLNNGTEFNDSLISKTVANNQIYISVHGISIVDAAIIFGNKNNTSTMECYNGIYKYIYKGFTDIDSVSLDTVNNNAAIYMSGSDTSIERETIIDQIFIPEGMKDTEEE